MLSVLLLQPPFISYELRPTASPRPWWPSYCRQTAFSPFRYCVEPRNRVGTTFRTNQHARSIVMEISSQNSDAAGLRENFPLVIQSSHWSPNFHSCCRCWSSRVTLKQLWLSVSYTCVELLFRRLNCLLKLFSKDPNHVNMWFELISNLLESHKLFVNQFCLTELIGQISELDYAFTDSQAAQLSSVFFQFVNSKLPRFGPT